MPLNIMCDLPITNHPREFRGVYKRLIPNINKAYMKIEYSKSGQTEVQSSIWETIHRNFMCAYFAKLAFNESATCLLCKNEQLTRTHIFLNWEVILI